MAWLVCQLCPFVLWLQGWWPTLVIFYVLDSVAWKPQLLPLISQDLHSCLFYSTVTTGSEGNSCLAHSCHQNGSNKVLSDLPFSAPLVPAHPSELGALLLFYTGTGSTSHSYPNSHIPPYKPKLPLRWFHSLWLLPPNAKRARQCPINPTLTELPAIRQEHHQFMAPSPPPK